jgi:methylmalonyl-CoA mutase
MPGDDSYSNHVDGDDLPLTDHDYASWEAAVNTALRGQGLRSLTTQTWDGIEREPLYTRAMHGVDQNEAGLPGSAPFTRGSRAAGNVLGWEIRQTHFAQRKETNKRILSDLEGGVTGITLIGAPTEFESLDSLLDGVYLDLVPIHLNPGSSLEQINALVALCDRRCSDTSLLRNSLGLDPVGRLARTGRSVFEINEEVTQCADAVAQLSKSHPNIQSIALDGSTWADAGASDGQELGAALSTGVMWLRALTAVGLSVDEASRQFELTLAAGPDQFLTTAKFRAARICWSRIIGASGGDPVRAPLRVHATTARSMMTRNDPWVNMLRTTTACFAAALGGADAITVEPFDSATGLSDDTGLRLARNTQLILQEESKVSSVIDPAGGSWYLEELTNEAARSSWKVLQQLEESGGIGNALASGSWQASIAETRDARLAALADRSTSITGTSEFPDIAEAKIERQAIPSDWAQALGEARCEPLPLFRWSGPFEQLRAAADSAITRPSVFLANLGDVVTHTARSTFAKNLFEAGGVQAISHDGFETPAEAAEAFATGGYRIACICSTDDVYSDSAVETATALRAAGAELIYLAGSPNSSIINTADVDGFIYRGCNVLDVLATVHTTLIG